LKDNLANIFFSDFDFISFLITDQQKLCFFLNIMIKYDKGEFTTVGALKDDFSSAIPSHFLLAALHVHEELTLLRLIYL